MKKFNHISKKTLTFVLIHIALTCKLFASESSFTITPWTGFVFNNTSELVYNNGIKESQLEWQNYSPILGVDLSYKFSLIKLGLGAYTAFPLAAGTIEDKDFSIDKDNNIIKYSNHNLITDKNYALYSSLNVEAGNEVFTLGFGFTFKYNNIKMESDDGYLQYPDNNQIWTGTEDKEQLNGTCISYEQAHKLIGYTAYVNGIIGSKVPVSFYFTHYPIIYIDAIDNHFMRSIQFYDSMDKGSGISTGLSAGYIFKQNNYLYCKVSYDYYTAKGTTRVNSLGIITHNTYDIKDNCTSGTEVHNWSIDLGLTIKF